MSGTLRAFQHVPNKFLPIPKGPGISQEQQATLFHPFAVGIRSTGLGLGLYLANKIAQAHEGTLMIESSQGQGVQATLALPLEEDEMIMGD